MRQEVPRWAIFGAVAVGVIVLAGVFLLSGQSGGMSPERQKIEQEHAEIVKSRYESNFEATPVGAGKPAKNPEELAREQYGGE
ncbi:MAG: hypothetical protein AB7F50_06785 [Fimbriimonadaceae bacterium]